MLNRTPPSAPQPRVANGGTRVVGLTEAQQRSHRNAGNYGGQGGQYSFSQSVDNAPLARQMGRASEGGYEYRLDPNTGRPLGRTALQNTERYQGDNYLRGLTGVDQLGAYDAETRRTALGGLMGAFQGLTGGAGGAPGMNITGPGGPVASVNYQTSIDPQQQVYNAQPGMAQMQAAPPQASGAGGKAFANNYAGMGQANANALSRGNTQAQGQYTAAATQAQNSGALAGLGQQNRAASNQSRRRSNAFGMGTNMMAGLFR